MDPAQQIADQFKLKGHLDKIKKDILTKDVTAQNTSMEELIKRIVSDMVKQMVEKDEELIFKNRASTSAELESRITKNYYSLLDKSNKQISLNGYINYNIQDPKLKESIRSKLKELLENNEEMSSKYV